MIDALIASYRTPILGRILVRVQPGKDVPVLLTVVGRLGRCVEPLVVRDSVGPPGSGG